MGGEASKPATTSSATPRAPAAAPAPKASPNPAASAVPTAPQKPATSTQAIGDTVVNVAAKEQALSVWIHEVERGFRVYPKSISDKLDAAVDGLTDVKGSTVVTLNDSDDNDSEVAIDWSRGREKRGTKHWRVRRLVILASSSSPSEEFVRVTREGAVDVVKCHVDAAKLEGLLSESDTGFMLTCFGVVNGKPRSTIDALIALLEHVVSRNAITDASMFRTPHWAIFPRPPAPKSTKVWTCSGAGRTAALSYASCCKLTAAAARLGSSTPTVDLTIHEVGCGVMKVTLASATKGSGAYVHAPARRQYAIECCATVQGAHFTGARWCAVARLPLHDTPRDICRAQPLDPCVSAWLESVKDAPAGTAALLIDGEALRVDFSRMRAVRMFTRDLRLYRIPCVANANVEGRTDEEDLDAKFVEDSSDDEDALGDSTANDVAEAINPTRVYVSVDPRTKARVPYSLKHNALIRRAVKQGRSKVFLRLGATAVVIDLKSKEQHTALHRCRDIVEVPVAECAWLPWLTQNRDGSAVWTSIDPLTRTAVPYPEQVSKLLEETYLARPNCVVQLNDPFGCVNLGLMFQGAPGETRHEFRGVRRFGAPAFVANLAPVCPVNPTAPMTIMTHDAAAAIVEAQEKCVQCDRQLVPTVAIYACGCTTKVHYRCAMCAATFHPALAAAAVQRTPAAAAWSTSGIAERAVQAVLRVRDADFSAGVGRLTERVRSLSLQSSPSKLMEFMSQQPVIVHAKLEKLEHAQLVLKDTHLRNQFETSVSGGHFDPRPGGTRGNWESVQFDGIYDGSPGAVRPKYGVCNFTRDVRGVKKCLQYGRCYLVLKPHVRARCTLTPVDSGSLKKVPVGTFSNCADVVAAMSDDELRALDELASGKRKWSNSKCHKQYVEVQIHGEVRLDRDIAAVGVHAKAAARPVVAALVDEFCNRHGITKIMIPQSVSDDDDNAPSLDIS